MDPQNAAVCEFYFLPNLLTIQHSNFSESGALIHCQTIESISALQVYLKKNKFALKFSQFLFIYFYFSSRQDRFHQHADVSAHLQRCLAYGFSARTFLQRFFSSSIPIQVDFQEAFCEYFCI